MSPPETRTPGRIAALTIVALFAFAANSILCRAALGARDVDAATFSAIRIGSGAVMLSVLLALRRAEDAGPRGSFAGAGLLFLYAVPFSLAYTELATGTGALLLFGAVQATMQTAGLLAGERPPALTWLGLVLALAGLVYLVLPGVSAPPLLGSGQMATAGVAWGLYSLRGRGATDPLALTAGNFVRAVPMVLGTSVVFVSQFHLSTKGALLAIASGALASGVGYAIWYAALRGLTATRAATVQLSVPVLAAAGGTLFMGESVTTRLLIASLLILGGVGLALGARAGAR